MTALKIKNGVGSPEDRSLFKKLRETLTEVEQRQLASKLGLQVVEPITEPEPVMMRYSFQLANPIIVEATTEEEARRIACVKLSEYVFESSDLSLESTDDVEEEDVEEEYYSEDE